MLSLRGRCLGKTTHVEARCNQVNTKGRNSSSNESANRRSEERLDNFCRGLILQHLRDARECGAGQPEGADEEV